ncbi:MarR family transcriptional regulator [Sphingomonas sp. KR3-1]|uniref:MarR family winged helix-turn-helix transcriptional regulator n=1 Tax=Sphingomonas sp. KR3-1 TaxID=3156611 RepID=UPI0032B4B32B
MHHEPLPPACACTLLRKAARVAGRLYDAALAGHDMSIAQFALLRHIARGEPLALSRLAEQLEMDRSSLYRAIAPLEKRGWVEVTPGAGRSKAARLTEAGRAALHAAEPDWAAMQHRVEAEVGTALWKVMKSGIETLSQGIERAGARA